MLEKVRDYLESVLGHRAVIKEMIVCLRQLVVMYTAGIPFERALYIISRQATQPRLRSALSTSQRRILSGQTIASALSEFPDIFPELYVKLMEVGENTGKLDKMLGDIANHAEKAERAAMRLQAALVYPAFVMALCLLFLIIGPAYLLRGLYEFLAGLSVPLPFSTRFLIHASSFMRTPLFPISVILVLTLSYYSAKSIWRDFFWRHCIQCVILAIPGIGPFYRSSQVTTFARALAIIFDSGMPLVQGLELVRKTTGLLRLQGEIDNVREQVIAGEQLYEALSNTGFFPPVILQFIKAGEESGDMGGMLNWSAWICEQNNEQAIEMMMEALQPFVLLIIGIIVGFMIVATMSPMLGVIQEIS